MPTWKEKKDQGIQNPFEREIITKFFWSKDNKWILSLKKRDLVWSTMYGILKWGGEGPHEARASYQVAMSPRLPRDSGTLCLRTKWQAIVRVGAQQWYLWYLRQPGLQISTELVIKEERAHVEWKPSQWSCCWVGRDVSQVKLSKFTAHILHCLPEFVHGSLRDMILCYTFVFIFWKLNEWVWWELV